MSGLDPPLCWPAPAIAAETSEVRTEGMTSPRRKVDSRYRSEGCLGPDYA